MSKKRGLLSWFDRNIKTKEDFQFLIVSIFIILIVCTKCYLSLSNNTGTSMQVQDQTHGSKHSYINSVFSFINSAFSFIK
ncbi:hypothetical protein GCM10022392_02890 [Mucilaginibacter panaciglaebae]|uniref:Uncharacterized protein n=1 Tax=Mucilaginibacter panaciglaebae TaxID=502331 RepID=A0ABP7WBN5_9SPHI